MKGNTFSEVTGKSQERERRRGSGTFPLPRHFERWQEYGITPPLRIATASMNPEIFILFRNTGLSSGFRICNTVIVIYLRDFSTPSHIRFLYSSTIRRVPPLEMTLEGKCHYTENVFAVYSATHPVISSGGRMLHDSTAQIRYSFDESRNLSCVPEYKAFCRLPLRQSRDRNSKGGAFQFVRRHHHSSFLIFSRRFHHLGRDNASIMV